LPLSGAEFQIGNMLEWSTALELNNERFIIQRSLDGISYEDIGRVDAAGLSNEETPYHFMDIGINDQKAYGENIKEVEQSVNIGLNSLFFDLENEHEGIYKVRIKMGDEEETLIIRKVMDEVKSKPNVASKDDQMGG